MILLEKKFLKERHLIVQMLQIFQNHYFLELYRCILILLSFKIPCLARLFVLIYLTKKFFHIHLLPLLTLIIQALQIQKFQTILIFFYLRSKYYLVIRMCQIEVNLIKKSYNRMNLKMQYCFNTYCSSFYFQLIIYFMYKNIFNH